MSMPEMRGVSKTDGEPPRFTRRPSRRLMRRFTFATASAAHSCSYRRAAEPGNLRQPKPAEEPTGIRAYSAVFLRVSV